jgi:phospholipase/carboxylesterase
MLDTEFIRGRQQSNRLLVALHGLGDSLEGYRWMPEALGLPWLNYLLVNAPDPYFGGFAWYDLDHNAAAGIERSRKLLIELLETLPGKNFPPEKTVLFGFSQGCLLSIEVGARYPRRLAGIVGVSGYVQDPEALVRQFSPEARRQRFLLTHGTLDPLIPIERVRPQVEFLRKAGLQIEWREFVKAHTIEGESEIAVIRDFIGDGYG